MTAVKYALMSFALAFVVSFAVVYLSIASQTRTTIRVRVPTEYIARPNCPTEDSCRVEYRDGVWYVIPAIP